MSNFKEVRVERGFSQRSLALKAGVAYKSIQLLESISHDARLSTVEKVAHAFGFPQGWIEATLQSSLAQSPDAIFVISSILVQDSKGDWQNLIFNFVDAFRKNPNPNLIRLAPHIQLPQAFRCLLASIVETLCDEKNQEHPTWCGGEGGLEQPWFVSGVENLKAMALLESPVHFRKRNIFVLGNFLDRA